jgi:DNA (cytosine-5)-methyltransferase 1
MTADDGVMAGPADFVRQFHKTFGLPIRDVPIADPPESVLRTRLLTEGAVMRIGSLCTGYGGLDMAVQAVFGGELAWWSDIEPGPIAVMERHHPGVMNVHDIRTAASLFELLRDQLSVDILTAGYPCQPFSPAGLRLGEKDERHLWPWIATAVGALRPGLIVLENVARHARVGLARVVGDLAALGYDAMWTVIQASNIGAPHQRKRLFVLATDASRERGDRSWDIRPRGRCEHPDSGVAVADAVRERLAWHPQRDGEPFAGQDGERGPDADRRTGADFGPYQAAVERWERVLGRIAPAPTTTGQRGARVLNPVFVEWMMGLPAGHVTSTEGLSRNAMLKLLGNGVVPQQAEYALRHLVATTAQVDGLVAA